MNGSKRGFFFNTCALCGNSIGTIAKKNFAVSVKDFHI